ncbi:unnamed protein product [Rhizophagus irregularis]|nr:unnamed protein product [Rhizophagus irregularis]
MWVMYQDNLAKNSMDQMVLDITSEAEIIKNNEDCYDYRQVYLKALLKSTSRGSIREIWRIIPYMTTKTYQHIIILNDGTHLSTCLLLVSHGIICHHYFKLMVENQDAVFHILLMSAKWLQDNAWENIESLYNEPFISAGGHKSQNTTLQGFIPRHYNNVQEVQVRHQMQKKMEYGRIMGYFKKALNYSIEENDQKNLDNLILSYIANKEKQRENTQLAVIEGHQTSDDIVKLSDGRVYNASDIKDPLAHRGKGRPPTK